MPAAHEEEEPLAVHWVANRLRAVRPDRDRDIVAAAPWPARSLTNRVHDKAVVDPLINVALVRELRREEVPLPIAAVLLPPLHGMPTP